MLHSSSTKQHFCFCPKETEAYTQSTKRNTNHLFTTHRRACPCTGLKPLSLAEGDCRCSWEVRAWTPWGIWRPTEAPAVPRCAPHPHPGLIWVWPLLLTRVSVTLSGWRTPGVHRSPSLLEGKLTSNFLPYLGFLLPTRNSMTRTTRIMPIEKFIMKSEPSAYGLQSGNEIETDVFYIWIWECM